MPMFCVHGTSPIVYFNMKHKDNAHIKKGDGDTLGDSKKKPLSDNPAPREDKRESDTTPPDHEVYVDLEPDELHLGDIDQEPDDVSKK
jgi:hypothetical protein